MGTFNDRVFGANVDQKTKEIFNALQRGQYEFRPGESVTNLPEHTRYLGEKTTFARMWVAVSTSGSDVANDTFYYSINDNKVNSYEPNQSIDGESYFVENTENPYLKPTAGITSISSRTEGALGAVRRTTVEFVVHNKNDFDNIYLPFFLRPGATVVVDFGWADKNMELYDIGAQISNTDTELSNFKKFIYGGVTTGPNGEEIFTNSNGVRYYNVEGGVRTLKDNEEPKSELGWVDDHRGLVDTNIGIVTTYNSKVTQNGSFECSVELVSQNATILDSEVSSDNNLKFIFQNKIEDILIQALTGENFGNRVKNYNVLSGKDKEEFLYGNDSESGYFAQAQEDGILGYIPEDSVKLGIYYEENTPNNQNALYISFGVFNDLFLNNFIAKNNNNKIRYEINFKLRDYYVRFEPNLYRRQVATMSGGDELPVFLYPEDWTDSVDGKKGENTGCGTVIQQKDGTNPYGTPVIPLRELFISVGVIKEAFEKKQNVNDAINYILDAINDDSYGIFDLKMIAPNRSYSEIGIQDRNLNNPLARSGELLTFDVTSGNGVVNNMDYSFETPKGDLQSMLAIGNKTDQSIFDVNKLDNLNFINILKSEKFQDKEVFIKSLPFNDVVEPTADNDDVNTNEIDVRIPTDYFKDVDTSSYEDNFSALVEDYEFKAAFNTSKTKSNPKNKPNNEEDNKSKGKVLSATSDRDFWGKKAKLQNILKSQEETISPILPINLSLSVYGNTHLNIGDIFTINFLPKSYQDYVYFQVVGVEHKIGSSWETSYQTAFRIRPSEKKQVVDTQNADVKFSESTIQQTLNDSTSNESVNDSVEDMTIVDVDPFLATTAKKMVSNLEDKDGDKEIKEKGNLPNILDTFLIAKQVSTPQHVKMAYAWSETILEYVNKLEKEGRKAIYYIRYGELSNSKGHYDDPKNVLAELDKEKGKDFDIFLDIDVDYGSSGSTLKEIYWKPQSDKGWGRGISDDREVVEAIFETQAKKPIYKNLIDKLNSDVGVTGQVKRNKVIEIKKNYAPIISRVRFKTADLGSSEKGEWFLAKPQKPRNDYITDFISDIKLPVWFVNNDLDNFLKTFYNKLDSIIVPEKT